MAHSPDDHPWIERLAQEARILGEARMLRDEQPLTEDLRHAVIDRLREYLARAEKSEAWAAKSMGVASATLSQVLSGSYGADDEKHIRAIDKWTEQQILRENAPKPAGFVKIGVAEKIYAVAKWVQKINAIGVVTGPAGTGKTITAKAIRAETPGSIYIRVTTAGQSKLAVLQSLCVALRLTGVKMTSRQMEQRLNELLSGTNRLIIVDEAHKLVEKRKDEALHTLRDLHDETGCPMLWLGMNNLATYIQSGKNDFEPLDQLNSRIKWWLNLGDFLGDSVRGGGGRGLYSIEDIRKLLAGMKIRTTADAERYLQMLANERGQGALRTVATLLQIAMAFVKDNRPIDAATLRDIGRQRLGARLADQVDQFMEIRAAKVG